jgi:hypothetical protein
MTTWEYRILMSWWEETGRTEEYNTRIHYRHVWQPGAEVEEFSGGMTANLGADGWELITAAVESTSVQTLVSRQGNDSWSSVPVYRMFFKRPAVNG